MAYANTLHNIISTSLCIAAPNTTCVQQTSCTVTFPHIGRLLLQSCTRSARVLSIGCRTECQLNHVRRVSGTGRFLPQPGITRSGHFTGINWINGSDLQGFLAAAFNEKQVEGERALSNMEFDSEDKHMEETKSCCLYVRHTIHAGETVEHSGTIVVQGDVDHGGIVQADGDIIILGRLHGDAHAGRSGDRNAIVFALQMEPTEIGVSNIFTSGPENHSAPYAEIALLLVDGKIGIEPALDLIVERSRNNAKSKPEEAMQSDRKNYAWRLKEEGVPRKPARMSLFTGAYISVIGLALFLFPKPLFGILFDVESVTLGWIRVGAVLAVVFGIYYIGTGWGDANGCNGAESFYLSTVVGRVFLFFSFCWLVGIGAAPPPLLIIAAVNLIGAILMLRALQETNSRMSRVL